MIVSINVDDSRLSSGLDQLVGSGVWGHYMTALYQTGRQAGALKAFSRLTNLLGEEMGIEPGADLTELEERILLHAPEKVWKVTRP